MRELKFKIYDKNDTKGIIGPFTWNKLPQFLFPENFTVLQYTGLKDKNNVEIYEGDIVTYQQPYRASRLTHPATTDSYRTIVAPVIYNEDSFQFEIDSYPIGTPMIKTRKDLKIIGNIFENPELLK